MQFYRFEGVTTNEKWAEENQNDRLWADRTRWIATKTDAFNQKSKEESFFFVENAYKDRIIIGAFCQKTDSPEKQLNSFLKTLGMELRDTVLEEITFDVAQDLLNSASFGDYIYGSEKVMSQFNLDKIRNNRMSGGVSFGENMIESCDKKTIYAQAERLLAKDSLTEELDRIYACNAMGKAIGHPVHYMVETDDRETRSEIYRLLLQSLYDNHRLRSRRYVFLDIQPGDNLSDTAYDSLYQSCIGGTVVVRILPGDADDEEDTVTSDRENVDILCEVMNKFRNQVLTVFCFPRECTKMKAVFCENLGGICFVELKEEFASDERAVQILKMIAKEKGIRTNQKLFARLEKDQKYLIPDLYKLFDAWYDEKLKKDIYPQYKGITTPKEEIIKSAPKGSAYDELTEMIGLDEAKKVIRQALNYYKAQKIFSDKGMKADRPALHMVFTGNPGTAKTTVARLFARIMKENDLLSTGHIIEVGRGDLVGKFVGWTAPTIQKKFRAAQGGVLFIDEAYSLVDDRDGSYGDEAINTIVQEMENHRDDVVVIFAGYPDKMERFLQKNPGLRSRIAFHVPFADYNTEELCEISDLTAKKKGLTLNEGAKQKLGLLFEQARKENDFGNGRYVRNVIEKAKMAQAERLVSMDYDTIKTSDVTTICAEDIELPSDQSKQMTRKIGF